MRKPTPDRFVKSINHHNRMSTEDREEAQEDVSCERTQEKSGKVNVKIVVVANRGIG